MLGKACNYNKDNKDNMDIMATNKADMNVILFKSLM